MKKILMRNGFVAVAAVLVAACGAAGGAGAEEGVDVTHYTGVAKEGMSLPFSKAVKAGDTIYLSGELGIDPATNELAPGGAGPETTQIFKNIEATLSQFDADLTDIVKCQVFLGDMSTYGEMNAAYSAALPDPKPARSTFGAAGLALGAALEIECLAVVH